MCGHGRTPANGADRRGVATRVAVSARLLAAGWRVSRPAYLCGPRARPQFNSSSGVDRASVQEQVPLGGSRSTCTLERTPLVVLGRFMLGHVEPGDMADPQAEPR